MKAHFTYLLTLGLACTMTGCPTNGSKTSKLRIDGSSTVHPITEAVAESYRDVEPGLRVVLNVSGTGGGFKKFVKGETDINNASRPIKDKELKKCEENKVEFIELPVAFDGITIAINPKNSFVDHLTVAELKKIWDAGSKVTTWKDIRSSWPAEKIKLYSPGTSSGTFDYFTEAINGHSGQCRSESVSFSEDDNVLVQGVAGDQYAVGFFGFAYYVENKAKLKAVPIKLDEKSAAITPSDETINNGSYKPLSRPIFIYVSKAAAERKEVQSFVNYYMTNGAKVSGSVGYVALPKALYELAQERFNKRVTGSAFKNAKTAGVNLMSAYKVN
ncbi:MAG: PstS family phosphate ABC transporter substrate-binding protein [Planctomycetota bacterium]|nr:PstS family phosphate ABC transporter substrate-binding protein [Planctomycetota bacterium]